MSENRKIHVLFACAEAEPLAKVGGLGDVAGVLPKVITNLAPEKIDMRLILPFHSSIKQKNIPAGLLGSFEVQSRSGFTSCDLYVMDLEGLTVYLLDNDVINHNSPVYYGDSILDGRKYTNFSVALLQAMKYLDWQVDILHANDWHTALSVYACRSIYKNDSFFKSTKTILSVHNLPFNGYGADIAMTDLGFLPHPDPDLPVWARMTPLPAGLASADKIIAVSPGYAEEILTPDFGCGLDTFLNVHKDKILGILNGIDIKNWDPNTDELITEKYSVYNLNGKEVCKASLQKELNLEVNPDIPLLTVVSRLDYQKGMGLIFDSLKELRQKSWQLVLLGTGTPELESRANELSKQLPLKFVSVLKYDNEIAHKLYASGDIFLMPSLYEPCGLSQMIAMRYGNIPLARATGGLRDSIIDYRKDTERGTGFLFSEKSVDAFVANLNYVLRLFADKSVWNEIQQNAMNQDFSWTKSGLEYIKVYLELTDH